MTLRIRTGVNTGEVVAGSAAAGSALVLGDAVNVAARLEQAATPGEVLLGQTTWELVRDAIQAEPVAPLALKGKAQGVAAWRLLGVSPDIPGHARRRDIPMVGREAERQLLLEAFDRVVAERACRLVTVLGAAGVGKTRLVDEALASVGERAVVLRGRCLSYGEGITYWPVAEVVRQAAGISLDDTLQAAQSKLAALLAGQEQADLVASRIAASVGLAEAGGGTEETFWAVRQFLEHLGRGRPLVVVVDDLHWAEPTLLDLVEYLASFVRDAPMLLIGLARTELLDARSDWGRSVPGASTILLEPLNGAESGRLVEQLLGMAGIDQRAATQITAQAGGNPLFLEELVAKLLDDRLLRREGGRWVASAELDRTGIPATIQVLLAARLEQLPAGERAVLERASVVGKSFSWAAMAALAKAPGSALIGSHLASLVRRDLLRPDASDRAGEDGFQFRHDLIRDAAYQALPKQDRADLHERFALWLQQVAGERMREQQELIGYHLEQAYRFCVELGPPDDHARTLARAAAAQLGAAGQRALARDDRPAAASLLHRAASLLPAEEPARLQLLPDLGVALVNVGELEQAGDVLAEAATVARTGGEERLAWRASLDYSWVRLLTHPDPDSTEAARREAEQAITRLTELDDDLGLAKAWLLLSEVHNIRGRFGAKAEAAEQALQHARLAGAAREEHMALGSLLMSLRLAPVPVEEGLRRGEQLLQQASGDRFAEVTVRPTVAVLQAMRGRFREARDLIAEVRAFLEELGLDWTVPLINRTYAVVDLTGRRVRREETPQREHCGCQHAGPRGGVSRGVSPVPYHPPALPPGHPRPRPTRHRHRRHPDHARLGRPVRDRPGPAGRAPHADTRDAHAAGPLSRRAQPAAPHHALVDPQPDGRADRLGHALGDDGLPVPGRRRGREGVCQAAAVGRLDLLVRQEAQGLRHARRGGAVVQHRRGLADPGRLPPVAAQTILRAGRLPDQTGAGCADAHRAERRARPGGDGSRDRRAVRPPGRLLRRLRPPGAAGRRSCHL